VRASSAFDAPDVLSMFVGEMRKQAQDLQATIVTLVAPKAAVSFPQVGRGGFAGCCCCNNKQGGVAWVAAFKAFHSGASASLPQL
jgi:hypothetical protein